MYCREYYHITIPKLIMCTCKVCGDCRCLLHQVHWIHQLWPFGKLHECNNFCILLVYIHWMWIILYNQNIDVHFFFEWIQINFSDIKPFHRQLWVGMMNLNLQHLFCWKWILIEKKKRNLTYIMMLICSVKCSYFCA